MTDKTLDAITFEGERLFILVNISGQDSVLILLIDIFI